MPVVSLMMRMEKGVDDLGDDRAGRLGRIFVLCLGLAGRGRGAVR